MHLGEFGELLHARRTKSGGSALGPRMVDERYVGHHERTGAIMTMSSEGVEFGMGIARRDAERRW